MAARENHSRRDKALVLSIIVDFLNFEFLIFFLELQKYCFWMINNDNPVPKTCKNIPKPEKSENLKI